MKINMETDYALRIMRCLAKNDSFTDAKTVSDYVGVTQRYTLKILGKLVSGGVVVSHKGANGGYRLAMAANEITLRMIIEIVDGPIVISRCLSDGYVCPHDSEEDNCSCYFNKVFDDINMMIAEKLDSVTIADSL